jgi:TetR/AcrR family transcriptional regulator
MYPRGMSRSPASTGKGTHKRAPRQPSVQEVPQRNGDRRQVILEAAIAEFSAKGFSGARVDAIARRARSNKQLIYYYFDSKIGLYEAVLELMIAHTSELLDANNPHASIGDAVKDHVDNLLVRGGEEWIRFWLWEALETDFKDGLRSRVRAKAWERWVAEFRNAQERGEINPDYDPKLLALAVNSIVVMPYMTPIVTKLITGKDPQGVAFKREQQAFLAEIVKLLSPDLKTESPRA